MKAASQVPYRAAVRCQPISQGETISNMKLQFVFAAALALALVGCFGPSREQIAMQDGSNCTGMGFKEGSPEYAQCRMAMLQRRDNADAAYRAHVSSTLQNCKTSITRCRTIALITRPITIRHHIRHRDGSPATKLLASAIRWCANEERHCLSAAFERSARAANRLWACALRSLPHAGCSAFFAVIHWGQEGECKSSTSNHKPII